MAVLNRVLNIFVMLMAIVAVIIGWKLYERRNELRDRGDLMAAQIAETVKALDASSEKEYASNVTFDSASKKGTLDWTTHHADRSSFIKNLKDLQTQAETVNKERNVLSGNVVKFADIFELKVTPQDLHKIDQQGADLEKYGEISGRMAEFKKRHDELALDLVDIRGKFEDGFTMEQVDARAKRKENKDKIIEGIDNLTALQGRSAAALKGMVQALKSDRLNGVRPEDVEQINQATVTQLIKSAKKIDGDLNHLALVQKQVKKLEIEKGKLTEQLEAANDTNQALQATIDTRDKNIVNLKNKIVDLQAMIDDMKGGQGGRRGDTRYDGQVVKVNYDFNYLIISHDEKKDKISYGVQLTVARDREYICKAKVTKIYKNYAVAEILNTDKLGDVIEGDRVVWLD